MTPSWVYTGTRERERETKKKEASVLTKTCDFLQAFSSPSTSSNPLSINAHPNPSAAEPITHPSLLPLISVLVAGAACSRVVVIAGQFLNLLLWVFARFPASQAEMGEFQESDVLWPEEDMRQLRLAYGCGPQQGRRRHYGPGGSHVGGGAGANARESAAPVAIPCSAPASRRQYYQSCTLEFSRRDGGDDDEEGDEEMVPPHVLVARRLSGKTAFSVCTGQGRTLKGRDLSRVRNSVLRLTGFLEA